jgi:hypothetical protein
MILNPESELKHIHSYTAIPKQLFLVPKNSNREYKIKIVQHKPIMIRFGKTAR